MLDAFIIDRIRRREEREQRWQPRLELPVPELEPTRPPAGWHHDTGRGAREQDSEGSNGVIILDM